jgi:hypothetical protein
MQCEESELATLVLLRETVLREQRIELGARARVLLQHTEHRAGRGLGARLLNAAHDHAHVLGLDDDRDARRVNH